MNPSYPEDLYDDEDYTVVKKKSELIREMYSHIIIGFGFGMMFTVLLASLVAWVMGI